MSECQQPIQQIFSLRERACQSDFSFLVLYNPGCYTKTLWFVLSSPPPKLFVPQILYSLAWIVVVVSANFHAEALAAADAAADVRLLGLDGRQKARETTTPRQTAAAGSARRSTSRAPPRSPPLPPPRLSPHLLPGSPRQLYGSSPCRCSLRSRPFRTTHPRTPGGTTRRSRRRTAPSPPGDRHEGGHVSGD